MVGGGEVELEVPVVALATRMTHLDVGGRRSYPFVSFSALRWSEATGWSTTAVCNWFATSDRTLVRPRWSCGAGVGGLGRLTTVQSWNQTRALVCTKGEWVRED